MTQALAGCWNDHRAGLVFPLQQLEVMQNARAFRQGALHDETSGNPAAPEKGD